MLKAIQRLQPLAVWLSTLICIYIVAKQSSPTSLLSPKAPKFQRAPELYYSYPTKAEHQRWLKLRAAFEHSVSKASPKILPFADSGSGSPKMQRQRNPGPQQPTGLASHPVLRFDIRRRALLDSLVSVEDATLDDHHQHLAGPRTPISISAPSDEPEPEISSSPLSTPLAETDLDLESLYLSSDALEVPLDMSVHDILATFEARAKTETEKAIDHSGSRWKPRRVSNGKSSS